MTKHKGFKFYILVRNKKTETVVTTINVTRLPTPTTYNTNPEVKMSMMGLNTNPDGTPTLVLRHK